MKTATHQDRIVLAFSDLKRSIIIAHIRRYINELSGVVEGYGVLVGRPYDIKIISNPYLYQNQTLFEIKFQFSFNYNPITPGTKLNVSAVDVTPCGVFWESMYHYGIVTNSALKEANYEYVDKKYMNEHGDEIEVGASIEIFVVDAQYDNSESKFQIVGKV